MGTIHNTLTQAAGFIGDAVVQQFADDYAAMLRDRYGISQPFAEDDDGDQLELPLMPVARCGEDLEGFGR